MKKTLFFVMILCMFGRFGYSQPVEEGNILIDASYGWPNLWTSVFKTAVTDSYSTDVKVGSIGPLSAQFEYMVSDKIGFGLIFGYSNSSVSYKDIDSGYYYDLSVPRVRFMPKFSVHFGQSDVFDPYFLIAAGYGSHTYKYESDDPDYTGFEVAGISPIAFRLAFGGRYFFSDVIGAKFEIGLGGGGLLEFGVTAKF
ncbi:MAG: hypothetical protein A2W93_14635 [Bacteroidetes bacterium GWF2_43_63]|nr:MAG: hypothetical protein A2W94_01205 [Bacteroidetes bacterium GWE2_42_42]OFY52577.1 MAG: hypothetical protein A2W93_14635 [Bacteroidetes bacterium GWF2_43_63]HBG71485.1 hypothetical protein [Bacteroidales bacterium]HCB60763.1 hypothetical protein [Bacteroidales bacterium]HCY23512.1 hypothetical protein [Bacteroidales bacterium]